MKYLYLLITILLLPTLLWSNNYYFFQDVTRGFSLSNAAVSTVCEDENGFVWFGGVNGLYYHNTIAIEKVNLHNDNKGASKPIRIIQLYKDSKNKMWVCTEKGLYKYLSSQNRFEHKPLFTIKDKDTTTLRMINNIVQLKDHLYLIHSNKTLYKYNDQSGSLLPVTTSFSNNISFLHKDDNGIIYMGKPDGSLYQTENNLKTTKLLYHSSKKGISSICKSGNSYYIGYLWLGVDIINSNGTKIGELSSEFQGDNFLKDDHIRQIIKRKNGEIWIASYAGIVVLNKGKQTLINSRFDNGLPHQIVFCMCKGSSDKVWLGTYSGGLACYSDYNYIFKYIPLDYSRQQSDNSHISTICEDSNGHVWIGSEGEAGIKVFDPKTNHFIQLLNQETDKNSKGIKTLVPIGNELIAIGKNYSNKIVFYNYKKRTTERTVELPLKADPGVGGALLYGNKLWVHDRVRLITYDIHTEETKAIYMSQGKIWQLFLDSSHNLWIGSSKGLFVVKPGTDEVQTCPIEKSVIDLNESSVFTVCEDKNGNIWVGTMGQGVYIYSPDNRTLKRAPDHKLTAKADIYSLLKDEQDNIWYVTNQGLYRYDESRKRTDFYGVNDGISNTQNRFNASLSSPSGNIYIGTRNGFNIITPSAIKENPIAPSVYLADFTINNKAFDSDSSGIVNSTALTQIKSITLNADENTFGFKVVCNNYIKSEKNSFKYRLTNYENKWLQVSQNENIVFTKVPPGEYTFEAYGANNDKVWSKTPYQLKITILRPLYRRWYALLIYLFVVLAVVFYTYKEVKLKIRLRKAVVEANYKTKANEQIYSERIKLFTNISHEFRTPLSLILSPIRYMLNKDSLDDDTKQLLNVADRNAKRLLKLADQSLDYRLLEIDKLKASFNKHDIIQLTKDVYLCFEQEFIDRQIKFSFTTEFQKFELFIDGDMVEKVIYNLLSNALKYTPEKENIGLSISNIYLSENDYSNTIWTGNRFTGKAISVNVSNTGKGINQELLPHVFERFAKGKQAHETSTGIGLHLCKEYAILNGGNMQVVSKEGEGCSFTLNLPVTENTDFKIEEQKQLAEYEPEESEIVQQQYSNEQQGAFSILVVEDNGDLRAFLKKFLGAYYKVITAISGEQALTLLEDLDIDLLITDVSMSGMSGIELTKQLKQKPNYQHLPIIVMTAYIDRNFQMESILAGADVFITKPIDEPMLLAQINNIFEKKLLNKTDNKTKEKEPKKGSFILKAEQLVELNLQNPDFDITDLLNELNVSRTTLRRKIKAETQQNPSGFVRDIRLKNAVKLIRTNKFNIDEIAGYVGFNSTSYFIRTFKDKYGVTPNDYRKELKE